MGWQTKLDDLRFYFEVNMIESKDGFDDVNGPGTFSATLWDKETKIPQLIAVVRNSQIRINLYRVVKFQPVI